MTEQKIAPCPWCGGERCRIETMSGPSKADKRKAVKCGDCGACGHRSWVTDPVDLWNYRPVKTPVKSETGSVNEPTDLSEWPKDPGSGRYLCTTEKPMPAGANGLWAHRDAEELDDQEGGWPGGDIVRMECKGCGLRWKTELPQ